MIKSYRYIIILVCIAVLGIAGFQIYWLGNNYQLEKTKLSRSINEALVASVEQTLVQRGRFMFDTNSNKTREYEFIFHDTSDVLHYPDLDIDSVHSNRTQAIIHVSDNWRGSIDTGHLMTQKIRLIDDSLIKVDFDAVFNKIIGVLETDASSLKKIDSIYREELKARSLNSEFCLNRYLKDSIIESTFENPLEEGFSSRKVQEFHARGPQIAAIFPNFNHMLFRKMSLSIFGSLVLLAFTIFCFVYTLKILFRQKKMADVRRDFVSNMTHEFKTPISIISAVNEALTNFDILEDKAKTDEYLGIAKTEINRLSGMVEKVLDMAAYEKEDFKLEKTNVNLHDLIMQVKNQFTAHNENDVKIRFIDESKSPFAEVDESHMTSVLYNLIDNGVKYSPDKKEIEIQLSEQEKDYLISIKDQGMGIPKNQTDKIFNKFYRISTGDRHDVKGFGLGLSYVKKIIDLHGGAIDVNSTEGKGSTFTIILRKNEKNEITPG